MYWNIDNNKEEKKNFIFLKEQLKKIGLKAAIDIDNSCCPFVLPIRVNNRDDFRKFLMEKQIYCAVHWSLDGIREDERKVSVKNSRGLISLPIDQRYDDGHMRYLSNSI